MRDKNVCQIFEILRIPLTSLKSWTRPVSGSILELPTIKHLRVSTIKHEALSRFTESWTTSDAFNKILYP